MPSLSPEFVRQVREVAEELVPPILDLTTELTEVPAPTNDEGERATYLEEKLTDFGYRDIKHDDLHNVYARIAGEHVDAPGLLLAGHIDTVFPREVPISVRRTRDRLAAPGVGDNTLSVATLALLKEAFARLGVQPAVDVYVTGNVGEEGLGDLRGMRAVVDALPNLGGAIAIEGHSLGRVTPRAVGSRRLKVSVTGPGGHSWGDAGRPSAIHAMAKMVTDLDAISLQKDPKTSLNVGLFNAGISVNTIAPEATVVIDMRSTSAEALAHLVAEVEKRIRHVASDEITVEIEVVGERPAGEIPLDRGLSPIATEVLKTLEIEPTYDASSTDANIPISRGIPSLCIGLTTGGNAHRVDEFIRVEPLATGITQLILTTLLSARALADGTIEM